MKFPSPEVPEGPPSTAYDASSLVAEASSILAGASWVVDEASWVVDEASSIVVEVQSIIAEASWVVAGTPSIVAEVSSVVAFRKTLDSKQPRQTRHELSELDRGHATPKLSGPRRPRAVAATCPDSIYKYGWTSEMGSTLVSARANCGVPIQVLCNDVLSKARA